MRVDEAEGRFRAMLTETGLDVDRLEAHATWKVFKSFAAIPVDGAESDPDKDMLLNEWGTCEWSGFDGLHVGWSLTRQFDVYDSAGEYHHMEHLHCLLLLPMRPELEQVGDGGGLFWPSTRLDDFAVEVEESDAFAALRGMPVAHSWVHQEYV